MDDINHSPVPELSSSNIQMDFPNAIRQILSGERVTKLEWNNQDIYLLLFQGFLSIRKADGSVTQLLVSEADMVGEDWVKLPNINKLN